MTELEKEKRLAELRLEIAKHAAEAKDATSFTRLLRGGTAGFLKDTGRMLARGTIGTAQGLVNLTSLGLKAGGPIAWGLNAVAGDYIDKATKAASESLQKMYDSDLLKYSDALTKTKVAGVRVGDYTGAMEVALPTLLTMGASATLKGAGTAGNALSKVGVVSKIPAKAAPYAWKGATYGTRWIKLPGLVEKGAAKAANSSAMTAHGFSTPTWLGGSLRAPVVDGAKMIPFETASSILSEIGTVGANMAIRRWGQSTIDDTRESVGYTREAEKKLAELDAKVKVAEQNTPAYLLRNITGSLSKDSDAAKVSEAVAAYRDFRKGVAADKTAEFDKEFLKSARGSAGYMEAATNAVNESFLERDSRFYGKRLAEYMAAGMSEDDARKALGPQLNSELIGLVAQGKDTNAGRQAGYNKYRESVLGTADKPLDPGNFLINGGK